MDSPIHNEHKVQQAHQKELAQTVMRRQVALSLKITAIFMAILFGLPLFNYLMPEIANMRVFGFTLTWLVLGVLFYPLTWVLSWWFIRESEKIESDIATSLGKDIENTAQADLHYKEEEGGH